MRRHLRTILALLSFILCMLLLGQATLGRNSRHGIFLKRSDIILDQTWTDATPHLYYFNTSGGNLIFGHWRNPDIVLAVRDQRVRLEMLEHMRSMRVDRASRAPESFRAALIQEAKRMEEEIEFRTRRIDRYDAPDGLHLGYHDSASSDRIAKIPAFAGIKYDNLPSWTAPATGLRITIPIWWVLPLFLIAPVLRGRTILRASRRRRSGRCPNCGYDLRASPGKCPECGEARA